jgi:hypothetical protein
MDSGKISHEPSKNETKRKRDSLVREIEKVKKRREEREEEREEFERLRQEENRLREQEMYGDWQKKEDEFHLTQAKVRSKIRIKVSSPFSQMHQLFTHMPFEIILGGP